MQLEAGKVAVVTGAASGSVSRWRSGSRARACTWCSPTSTRRGSRPRPRDRCARCRHAHGAHRRERRGVGAGARGGRGRALRHGARRVQQRRRRVEADAWFGPLSAWKWVLGVNLWGVIHGVRAFLPGARRAGRRSHREHREHRRPAPGFRRGLRRDASTRSSRSPKTCTRDAAGRAPDRRERAVPGMGAHEHPRRRAQLAGDLGDEPAAALGSDIVLGHVRRVIDEGMPPGGGRRPRGRRGAGRPVLGAPASRVRRARGAALARHRRRRQSPARRRGARASVGVEIAEEVRGLLGLPE